MASIDHAGVWVRFLKTLPDEVTMGRQPGQPRSAATLAAVGTPQAGRPRAGLNVWRPYARLHSPHQQAVLEAAGTARGTLGPLLTRQPHRDAHQGDRWAWE